MQISNTIMDTLWLNFDGSNLFKSVLNERKKDLIKRKNWIKRQNYIDHKYLNLHIHFLYRLALRNIKLHHILGSKLYLYVKNK